VGRPSTRSLRRAIACAVVVGLHGLVITLIVALRNPPPLSAPSDFVSTVVLLSGLPAPAASSTRLRRTTASDTSLATVRPPTALPAKTSPSGDARAGTDWELEGQQAAAAVTRTPDVRGFGASPHVESARTGARPTPGHVQGEQYRTTDGAWVVGSASAVISSRRFPL
jgi:hypothetical protein